jgi:hypothetical protein
MVDRKIIILDFEGKIFEKPKTLKLSGRPINQRIFESSSQKRIQKNLKIFD